MSTVRKSIINKIESGEIIYDYFARDDTDIYRLWKNLRIKKKLEERDMEVTVDDYLTWMEKELEKLENS